MKRIYLVRHGETEGNLGGYWQGPEEPLNAKGLVQADLVAERIAGIDIDKAFVSSMYRTKQTAAATTKRTGIQFETSDLFRENKDPSSVCSTSSENAPIDIIQEYRSQRENYAEDPDWRFEDEENPTDFFKRIQQAADFLETVSADNILVVSHGNFIRCFTSYMLSGRNYRGSDMYTIKKRLKTVNTGITCFLLEDGEWQLLTWNDHAHFAE